MTVKWGPIQRCKKLARTRRGYYKCAACEQEVPATLPPKEGGKRRIKNAIIDHIEPVIDPYKGFQGWDEVVKRMFVEIDGFQCLCHACHQEKCAEERRIATERRQNEKDL